MRIRDSRVDFNGTQRQCTRLFELHAAGLTRMVCERNPRARHRGVRRRKFRIELERALVIRNGGLHALETAAIPVKTSLQICLIGLGPARRRASQHVDLVGHQFHCERPRDVSRNVGLQIQRFSHRPIVGVRPQVHFAARLDQLRGDADAIGFTANAAFKQIIGRELTPDLTGALGRLLELHRRGARDDAEAARAEPADLRDHFLREPIAEVFLSRIVAEVGERQHDEPHVDDGAGQRCDRRPHDVQVAHRLSLGLDSRDEPVTAPMQRFDEPRVVGIVAERGAKALDGRIQAVLEVYEGTSRPQTLTELFSRHHLAGPLQHDRQNLERLILQPDADAALAQLACA